MLMLRICKKYIFEAHSWEGGLVELLPPPTYTSSSKNISNPVLRPPRAVLQVFTVHHIITPWTCPTFGVTFAYQELPNSNPILTPCKG